MTAARNGKTFKNIVKNDLPILLILAGIAWAVEILDFLLPFFQPDAWGIRPRTAPGLAGIVLAPFLHSGFPHLVSNTLPFLILGGIVMLGGRKTFWKVTLFVAVAGGLGVWLLTFSGIHIGASGVIFGYLGFLLGRGIFERTPVWIAVSILIVFFYGGLLWGVLPGERGVSWQGHLFGLGAGLLAAWLMFPGGKKLYAQ